MTKIRLKNQLQSLQLLSKQLLKIKNPAIKISIAGFFMLKK